MGYQNKGGGNESEKIEIVFPVGASLKDAPQTIGKTHASTTRADKVETEMGGGGGYRTPGPGLMSPLLYQLSYTAV